VEIMKGQTPFTIEATARDYMLGVVGLIEPDRRLQLTEDPGAITVIKGNRQLSLRYSRKHRAILYASEPEYIEAALDDLRGWRELEIPPLTMLTFRHEALKEWQSHPFRFV
jgi:hypothetical protein